MILIPPADMSNPDVKLAATFERLAEMFAPDPVPDVFRVYANVPSFLHDFYMNFNKFVIKTIKREYIINFLIILNKMLTINKKNKITKRNYAGMPQLQTGQHCSMIGILMPQCVVVCEAIPKI